VVLGNGEPTAGAAVWGCLRPITVVVPDRGLESAPTGCGVSLLGASGVAAVLAGAVEDVEVGSVSAGVVAAAADETVEELVCGPPVATTTPGAPERVQRSTAISRNFDASLLSRAFGHARVPLTSRQAVWRRPWWSSPVVRCAARAGDQSEPRNAAVNNAVLCW
jgi:hypothetical protein